MRKLIFDIETNMKDRDNDPTWDNDNFAANTVSLACLCVLDVETMEQFTFHDNEDLPRDGTNLEGVKMLTEADLLIGHNIRYFDVPALMRLCPDYAVGLKESRKFDTLTASRDLFTWSKLSKFDKKHKVKYTNSNSKGLHSLGAYSDRLRDAYGITEGVKDDNYKLGTDWTNITVDQSLLDYCHADCAVNYKVFRLLLNERDKRQ